MKKATAQNQALLRAAGGRLGIETIEFDGDDGALSFQNVESEVSDEVKKRQDVITI